MGDDYEDYWYGPSRSQSPSGRSRSIINSIFVTVISERSPEFAELVELGMMQANEAMDHINSGITTTAQLDLLRDGVPREWVAQWQ